MGKNTFQSLAIAASMLGMSADKASAQGAGDQILETKNSIEALITSLDPVQFKAARDVLAGDAALLADGLLDGKDATTIRDHASRLLGISKDAAQKVLNSLGQNGIIENTVQTSTKPEVAMKEIKTGTKPPINERPEEKKQRLAEEKQAKITAENIENLNKGFFNKDSWKVDESQNATPILKVSKSEGIVSSFGKVKPNADPATAISTSTFSPALGSGEYEINMSLEGKGKLAAWFYSPTGEKMGPRIFITDGKNNFSVPAGTTLVRFGLINSKSEEEFTIKSFVLSLSGANKVILGNN